LFMHIDCLCLSEITPISTWKSFNMTFKIIYKRKCDIDNTEKYRYSDISKISISSNQYL
jgi:hypothetical protein